MAQELPSGEWYMPDLENTPLSDIIKVGNYFDKAGRLMHQFPKIAKYTGYDTYVIHPHTGGIEILDLDRNITLPFEVQAFRKPQDYKTVLKLVKAAAVQLNRRTIEADEIPEFDLPENTTEPFTPSQLGEIFGIYDEIVTKQAEVAFSLVKLERRSDREKYAELGFKEEQLKALEQCLEQCLAVLAADIATRGELGKPLYNIPRMRVEHNDFDCDQTVAKFTVGMRKELQDILRDISRSTAAARKQPSRTNKPRQTNKNTPQEELDTTPTTIPDNRPKPRKVGFNDDIHNTNINNRLKDIAAGNDPARTNNRSWHTVSDREKRGSTVSPINATGATGHLGRSTVSCYACGDNGHRKSDCTKEVWCDHCRRDTHCNETCRSKTNIKTRVPTSTPRTGHKPPPTPRQPRGDAQTENTLGIGQFEQLLNTHAASATISDTVLKSRKSRIRNIGKFDGADKSECITWLDLNKSTAEDLGLTLKEMLMETSSGQVYRVLTKLTHLSDDQEVEDFVLQAFSDVPTVEEAQDKLRTIRRKAGENLVAHNANYEAVHKRAWDCEPRDEKREAAWREYANSLDKDLAGKLNHVIGIQARKEIKSLEDTMLLAIRIEEQERKKKIYEERKALYDAAAAASEVKTTTINEADFDNTEECSFLQNRRPDNRFNSTMKSSPNSSNRHSSGYNSSQFSNNSRMNNSNQQHNNQFRNNNQFSNNSHFNNSNPSGHEHQQFNNSGMNSQRQDRHVDHGAPPPQHSFQSEQSNRYNNSNAGSSWNQGRRFVNRYRHPRGNPVHNIRFEYNGKAWEIIKDLKGIIRNFETYPGMRQNFRSNPTNSRYRGEVNECEIDEIGMTDLATIIDQDEETIYEALVYGDYIDESQQFA